MIGVQFSHNGGCMTLSRWSGSVFAPGDRGTATGSAGIKNC